MGFYLNLLFFLTIGVGSTFATSESIEIPIGPDSSESDKIQVGDMFISRGQTRAGVSGYEWPDNTIPYAWHKSIDPERKRLIKDAMEDIMKVVPNCWKFVKRGNHDHWVEYRNLEDECFSDLGNQQASGQTPQSVNFGGDACNPGGMIHELFHTLGISHEHSRNDRDYYIEPIWENIPNNPDFKNNFLKDDESGYQSDTFGLPYNFQSIMQYGFFLADAINPDKPVYVNKRNKTAINWELEDKDVGQAEYLTRQDIQLLARQGKCKEPKTERYNITNAKPGDRNIARGFHKKKHSGLELKLHLKMNR